MLFLATFDDPAVARSSALLHQSLDFFRASCSQGRYISIKHKNKRYDRNDISEEEMSR